MAGRVFITSCPDEPFPNLRAYRSGDRRILFSSGRILKLQICERVGREEGDFFCVRRGIF